LLKFVRPFLIVAFFLSCGSIFGTLFIISSWGFIGLRTESRKFLIILSVTNLMTSLSSLPILLILLPIGAANIPSLRIAHVVQVIMILNQYFATCAFFWTTIINFHLYVFVKYGRESLKWNKFFHLLVWTLALPSTIPIILGIYSNINFPMFAPSSDISLEIVHDLEEHVSVLPIITIIQFTDMLQKISFIMQLLTIVALFLWIANILSSILVKISLQKFFENHYLDKDSLKYEFGIDTSLTTVSQLLIVAQLPGLVFAWFWLFTQPSEWKSPIIIQTSFTVGASFQGILNCIYFLTKRDVRLRYWVLSKKMLNCCCKSKSRRPLINVTQRI